jgi:hypothetical protein
VLPGGGSLSLGFPVPWLLALVADLFRRIGTVLCRQVVQPCQGCRSSRTRTGPCPLLRACLCLSMHAGHLCIWDIVLASHVHRPTGCVSKY